MAMRTALELVMVVALGGMTFSALRHLAAGRIAVPRCPDCGRPVSRAYPHCPHCGRRSRQEHPPS